MYLSLFLIKILEFTVFKKTMLLEFNPDVVGKCNMTDSERKATKKGKFSYIEEFSAAIEG